jgi:hypothetical protein
MIEKEDLIDFSKKTAKIAWLYFVDVISFPTLINQSWKIIKYNCGFGASVFKRIVMGVITDPVMFFLIVGIALGLYIDELLLAWQSQL